MANVKRMVAGTNRWLRSKEGQKAVLACVRTAEISEKLKASYGKVTRADLQEPCNI